MVTMSDYLTFKKTILRIFLVVAKGFLYRDELGA
jgi:hypothetical protein